MFLGLRLNEGVSSSKVQKFDQSIESVFGQTINNLKEKKLIVERTMHCTYKSRKVIGNEGFEAFLIND